MERWDTKKLYTKCIVKFQFPSNGKAHGKMGVRQGKSNGVDSFNSLQTGKHMESGEDVSDSIVAAMFQFPSNGKAHGKKEDPNADRIAMSDSFNSLQTGKHMERNKTQTHGRKNPAFCFNSLQTGKHMERRAKIDGKVRVRRGFNSLQTGKHMESVSALNRTLLWRHSFNSLQTGKHMERRSLQLDCMKPGTYCFNSLQTGKHMERAMFIDSRIGRNRFQFPSNGKAHGKYIQLEKVRRRCEKFQFPSNGKAHGK